MQFRNIRIHDTGNAAAKTPLEPGCMGDGTGGPGWFHDGTELSHAVHDWHRYLRQGLRTCDPITGFILDLVEHGMLVAKPNDRLNSSELHVRMKLTIDMAEGLSRKNGYMLPSSFPASFRAEQIKESELLQQLWEASPKPASRNWASYESTKFTDATQYQRWNPPSFESFKQQSEGTGRAGGERRKASWQAIPAANGNGPPPSQKLGETPRATNQAPSPFFLSFWDARKLLEEKGWHSGPLGLPDEDTTHGYHGFFASGSRVKHPKKSLISQLIPHRWMAWSLNGSTDEPAPPPEDHRHKAFDQYFSNRDVVRRRSCLLSDERD